MADLDKLIEAVEAGNLPESVFHGYHVERGHWAYSTGLNSVQRTSVSMAYNGSLNDALALHDALLSGWRWTVCPHWVSVDLEVSSFWAGNPIHIVDGNPARAWLLATLRAHRAQVQP